MSNCAENICGLGMESEGPSLSDPNNSYNIFTESAYGGILISWTYPTVNPEAVRHMELYRRRSSSDVPVDSDSPYAIVTGDRYYDPIALEDLKTEYYYWIRVVAFSGYRGKLIGPAHAHGNGSIDEVMDSIAKRISGSGLAHSLQTEILKGYPTEAKYNDYLYQQSLNYAEITKTIKSNTDETKNIIGIQKQFNQELINRNDALLRSTNELAVATNNALASIEQTNKVKIGFSAYAVYKYPTEDPDSSKGMLLEYIPFDGNNQFEVYSPVITAYEKTDMYTKIGKQVAKIKSDVNAKPGDLQAWFTKEKITSVDQDKWFSNIEYRKDRTTIIDAVGVTAWNQSKEGPALLASFNIPALHSNKLVWREGLPLASVAKNVQVNYKDKTGRTQYMKLEEAMGVQVDATDKLMGQYQVKIDADGLITGFGLTAYSSMNADPAKNKFPKSTSFIINADTFSVSAPKLKGAKVEPTNIFQVVTTPSTDPVSGITTKPGVYIAAAVIKDLTFEHLASIDNSFDVTPAKYDSVTKALITPPLVRAKNLTVDRLSVGNDKTNGTYMEVTNDCITIKAGGIVRVKLGNLSV